MALFLLGHLAITGGRRASAQDCELPGIRVLGAAADSRHGFEAEHCSTYDAGRASTGAGEARGARRFFGHGPPSKPAERDARAERVRGAMQHVDSGKRRDPE